jgi:hypothetical protein
VDNAAMQQSILTEGQKVGDGFASDAVSSGTSNLLPELPLLRWNNRYFATAASEPLLVGFPAGVWELVGSFAAAQQEHYIYATPTLADVSPAGTPYAVFAVSAHTATSSVWFMSPPDSGFSVDNLPPGVPQGLTVAYNKPAGNQLTWEVSAEKDFQYVNVYRAANPDFVPGPPNLVHSTAATEWQDPDYHTADVHYKVTALDRAGNESTPASPGSTTGTGDDLTPVVFALYQNVPNPFNPVTTIRYDVPPGGGKVTLRVYDVSGSAVRTLVDAVESAGQKTVRWDGMNDHGEHVSSGVYFYRMTAPGFTKNRKMVLLQ